jgi:hypothetical protein
LEGILISELKNNDAAVQSPYLAEDLKQEAEASDVIFLFFSINKLKKKILID